MNTLAWWWNLCAAIGLTVILAAAITGLAFIAALVESWAARHEPEMYVPKEWLRAERRRQERSR